MVMSISSFILLFSCSYLVHFNSHYDRTSMCMSILLFCILHLLVNSLKWRLFLLFFCSLKSINIKLFNYPYSVFSWLKTQDKYRQFGNFWRPKTSNIKQIFQNKITTFGFEDIKKNLSRSNVFILLCSLTRK